MQTPRAISALGIRMPRMRPCKAQYHQLIRIRHRQSPHQRLVDQAEDGRIRPNRKRQRQHRHSRESRIPPEPAQCVLHIAPQRFQKERRPLLPALF